MRVLSTLILIVGLTACTNTSSDGPFEFQGEIPMEGKLIYSN